MVAILDLNAREGPGERFLAVRSDWLYHRFSFQSKSLTLLSDFHTFILMSVLIFCGCSQSMSIFDDSLYSLTCLLDRCADIVERNDMFIICSVVTGGSVTQCS